MAEGGATWKIIVEEGQLKSPTQSSAGQSSQNQTKTGVTKTANRAAEEKKQNIRRSSQVMLFSAGVATVGFNQYYSITGQSAKKNQMNATMTYGALGVRFATQIATGNIAGAAVTAVAGTLMFANTYVSFQKDITEQNAGAEYLRQRSNTSVSNGNDFYRFTL